MGTLPYLLVAANLSKQQKEELQRQAQEKYGLMPEQLRRVEEQIAELQASRLRPGMANGAAEAEAGDAGSSGTGGSIPALIGQLERGCRCLLLSLPLQLLRSVAVLACAPLLCSAP